MNLSFEWLALPRNLRIKLQDGWQQPRYIATIPGQGYRFVATAAKDETIVA